MKGQILLNGKMVNSPKLGINPSRDDVNVIEDMPAHKSILMYSSMADQWYIYIVNHSTGVNEINYITKEQADKILNNL